MPFRTVGRGWPPVCPGWLKCEPGLPPSLALHASWALHRLTPGMRAPLGALLSRVGAAQRDPARCVVSSQRCRRWTNCKEQVSQEHGAHCWQGREFQASLLHSTSSGPAWDLGNMAVSPQPANQYWMLGGSWAVCACCARPNESREPSGATQLLTQCPQRVRGSQEFPGYLACRECVAVNKALSQARKKEKT